MQNQDYAHLFTSLCAINIDYFPTRLKGLKELFLRRYETFQGNILNTLRFRAQFCCVRWYVWFFLLYMIYRTEIQLAAEPYELFHVLFHKEDSRLQQWIPPYMFKYSNH